MVGACFQFFHWFVFVWGCSLSLGGLDVIPDFLHVDFFCGHGRRKVLISSTFRLGQVVKWPFLMALSKVFLTKLNWDAWHHLASSGSLLASRALSAAGCLFLGGWVGLLVRLTCHMPDVVDLFPSSTVIPSLTTLM